MDSDGTTTFTDIFQCGEDEFELTHCATSIHMERSELVFLRAQIDAALAESEEEHVCEECAKSAN